ncbi:RNA 2',3'-cyclic phosphodiesterase [Streptomyces cavernicola]|uniref:RNA 2',3'-cyclic phosphodiesterase n=1 Tax=Streptomyces cavernicola TaxID=3043613 RepID=A0ABT6SKK1_9ACTN|nr:RNA 2',3'-cyclic phosphodiesterase [Streptomyces sp. B-S-A6]MDI3408384.1 RNA 2',3'-cyclic phosphodiesterase [Streptomyces sp. B-S-A6]
MRLFVAVLPPGAVVDELAAEVRELRRLPGADGLRWTEPGGWHFTLAFMGDVPEETLPELRERLTRAAHRTPAFRLALRGGGRFGDRALWAGADGEVDVMRRLAERSEAAARKAGIAMDGHRRYTPHLTLARSRAAAVDLRPYVDVLDAFASEPWTVGDLALVQSRLPRSSVAGERPRYEEVERWPLGAAG